MVINQVSACEIAFLDYSIKSNACNIEIDRQLLEDNINEEVGLYRRKNISRDDREKHVKKKDMLCDIWDKYITNESNKVDIKCSDFESGVRYESDYIVGETGKYYVNVNYSSILDLIALEIAGMDCFEELEGREKFSCNREISLDDSILAEHNIDIKGLYKDACDWKIENSYYAVKGNGRNYFYDSVDCGDTYKNILESSRKKVMPIILYNLMLEVKGYNKKISVIGFSDDSFEFIVDSDIALNILRSKIKIMILGYKFMGSPDVSIIELEEV